MILFCFLDPFVQFTLLFFRLQTPLINYYDLTIDVEFLKKTLFPLLTDIGAFYLSYMRATNGTSFCLPHTCAQERCPSGSDVVNSHQDIAYATLVFEKLLEYSAPTLPSERRAAASRRERDLWRLGLRNLPPFPVVDGIFADAAIDCVANSGRKPETINAGYGISHLAGIFPAQIIGTKSSSPDLLHTARKTVEVINGAVNWLSGGGFDMEFPQAARVSNRSSARALLDAMQTAIKASSHPNGYTETGGGGLEMIGGAEVSLLFV